MDRHRKAVLDALGRAASEHRAVVYGHGLSGQVTSVDRSTILEFCDLALAHLDATMDEYRRTDGLVHSYNLVSFADDGGSATVSHLPVMLEGQVAALGADALEPAAQAELLDALFASALFRADQQTFMLAPVRHLPSFVDKNVVPDDAVADNPLLSGLLAAGERSIVGRDVDGVVRFAADLVDAAALDAALARLAATETWRDLVEAHAAATADTYERVFGHRAFLGRSAAMYAYEGIGSIYWHMVSKLLLAVHDAASAAVERDPAVAGRLVDAYARVRSGLGFTKSAAEFGAVPTEPYSHTPAHAGAQQPGMTGAVKEEILTRPRELGVGFDDGEVVFDPLLLRRAELLDHPQRWVVVSADGEQREIDLDAGQLGLTICQVPVVVSVAGDEPRIDVELAGAPAVSRPGLRLGRDLSAMLFGRTGEIRLIRATLPDG